MDTSGDPDSSGDIFTEAPRFSINRNLGVQIHAKKTCTQVFLRDGMRYSTELAKNRIKKASAGGGFLSVDGAAIS